MEDHCGSRLRRSESYTQISPHKTIAVDGNVKLEVLDFVGRDVRS
ncbi:hypothetical protein HDF14_002945 [Edaphobacter lichenicola]|uniref:Uncharacterized protein n=1 Tax=Tunturiibacter gelidiferens TaxID=3069689 RepID=A0A9X0QFA2_9BACT|nr:hypothetical protein [Edaphobacter lichenicola]